MVTKRCARCRKTKPASEYTVRNKERGWLNAYCRPCVNAKAREWRRDHPGYTSAWGQRNPEKAQEHRRRSELKNKYGVTPEWYAKKWMEQGGRCAICGRKQKRLHVDHCHRTGETRGLLCGWCNRGLGFFFDNPMFLKAALAYMNRYASAHRSTSTNETASTQ